MSVIKKVVPAVLVSIFLSIPAVAQQPSAEQRAVDVRQSIFKLIQNNMGPIGAIVRGRADYDAAVVEKHITRVNQLSLMINDAFMTDTRGSGVETESLDVIWENMSDFQAKSAALTEVTGNVLAAISSGDHDAAQSAMSGVARTCGGCHSDYREDN